MSTWRGGKSQSIKIGLIHLNEEKHPNIELTHFCAIHLHAKVDTTIKCKKKDRGQEQVTILIFDNTVQG